MGAVAPAARLLATCRALGVRLEPRAGRLRVSAPRGIVSPELHEALAASRDALLELLEEGGGTRAAHPRSPSAALERAWRRAHARARGAFARAGRAPTQEDLEGAARLELAADPEAPAPEDERTRAEVRRLLGAIYAGRLVSRLGPDGRPRVAQAAEVLDLCRRPSPRRAPRSERTPAELVAEAQAYGLRLAADAAGLRVFDATRRLPSGEPARGELRIPTPLLRALAERRAEVLALLEAAGRP